MSNYGWTNEAGEPIMDGAAYRFEQQLDAESAEERSRMQWDDDFYADYPDECPYCGSDECEDVDGECVEDDDTAGLHNFGGEDSWLDGSYEE